MRPGVGDCDMTEPAYYYVPVCAMWAVGPNQPEPPTPYVRMIRMGDYDALRAENTRLRQELARRDAATANKRRLSRYDR